MSITNELLIKKAYEAMEHAYAPYSNFKVGAVAVCGDKIYSGCNIENASFGATICAERCAISKAVSEGNNKIDKIVIVSSKREFTMPCGICRQVISEFMKEGIIIVTDDKEIKEFKPDELMPSGFFLENVKGH